MVYFICDQSDLEKLTYIQVFELHFNLLAFFCKNLEFPHPFYINHEGFLACARRACDRILNFLKHFKGLQQIMISEKSLWFASEERIILKTVSSLLR